MQGTVILPIYNNDIINCGMLQKGVYVFVRY